MGMWENVRAFASNLSDSDDDDPVSWSQAPANRPTSRKATPTRTDFDGRDRELIIWVAARFTLNCHFQAEGSKKNDGVKYSSSRKFEVG